MGQDFVHLHVHSDYSMLDGACRIDLLCKRAAALGQKAIAVTDHGSMFGAFDLYKAARKHSVKPIVGCEFYTTPSGVDDRSDATRHHLVLLAKSYEGYRSLCRLNAAAWSDRGYYYKPRIDREILREHARDLICLSACVAGEIPDAILHDRDEAARETIEFFIDLFGKDDFFFELQYHAPAGTEPDGVRDAEHRELLEMERKVNRRLAEYAQEYGIGLVATNDAHYLNAEDWEAHDALLCVGTQSSLSDVKRLRFSGDQFYLKSGDEMAGIFADFPGALENSGHIADRCNLEMPLGENHYPVYRLDDGSDDASDPHCKVRRKLLRDLCIEGLAERYNLQEADNPDYTPRSAEEPDAERRAAILARLEYELGVIDRMGYISYFLVVWDFIRYARQQGIPVGPGRGSGAGSLVAFATGITDLDPLRYGLLFERFLNPDRVSPPDFDIDFCERRRGEVIEYVRNKYGAESVAQIGTFGTLKAKAVLKDVARVMGVPFADANRLVAQIPTDPKMTLEKALEIPEVKQQYEREPWVADVFERGRVLEGLNRNQSIHACGVIIGDRPLADVVPLARGAGKEWITQYPAYPCEELGLLKMDFLGLKTLTIIQDTVDMVNARTGGALTPESMPLDDGKTYDLLNRGGTVGVFQLESGGMQDLCRSFAISKLEEIIALVALYRPGPMEFIPTYINCKLGREHPEYDTPEMERILSETYGIMVYQEQIMQVVQAVAGFSLAQADIMRRAIGKKNEAVLLEQGERFRSGCLEMGHSPEVAKSIWDKILKFASYGFNKSHSACYGMMSYRTAFLKANYPAEFMAAVLNGELGNAEKLAFYINETRKMELQILPPDVSRSALRFGVADGIIRFGLGAVKGVGSGAAEAIIEARESGGPFKSLLDFCERCGDAVNRRVMENLCKAGAFDSFGLKRSQIAGMLDEAIARAQQTLRDRKKGQGSLFDMLAPEAKESFDLMAPDIPEWPEKELLSYEKELLGFYVTGHPIAQYRETVTTYQTDEITALGELDDSTGIRIGGLLAAVDLKRSKRDNRPWAIVSLEGLEGSVECLVFADAYEVCREILLPESVVFLEGSVSRREGEEMKVRVDKVVPVDEAPEVYAAEVHLRVGESAVDDVSLQRIADICREYPGETPVTVCAICASGELAFVRAQSLRVRNSVGFRGAVRALLGEQGLREKANTARPVPPGANRFRRKNGNGKGFGGGNEAA